MATMPYKYMVPEWPPVATDGHLSSAASALVATDGHLSSVASPAKRKSLNAGYEQTISARGIIP